MKAVFRLTQSQVKALCTVLAERIGEGKTQQFVDVSTQPPTTTTTQELLQCFICPIELETDSVLVGEKYPGKVSVVMLEERKAYVTLDGFDKRKHILADGTSLNCGDNVDCTYDGTRWIAEKSQTQKVGYAIHPDALESHMD